MKKTINHEQRIRLAEEIGIKAAAEKLGIQPQTIRLSLKKKGSFPQKEEPLITRLTNEDFDERFYKHKEKVNPRTGEHFFPSFSFLHSQGAPSNSYLSDFYKDKGYFADVIFDRRQKSGSYVHDTIDRMVKYGFSITPAQIEKEMPKSALEIKKCLLGFLNWWNDYQPIILSSEHMIIGEDMGGTVDIKCQINKDNYEKAYTIDLKTSKSIFDEHRMQVTVYSDIEGTDECAILQLGNSTAKKYTFSVVTKKDKEEFRGLWRCIKETAYHKLISEGWIKPKDNPFPTEFKILRNTESLKPPEVSCPESASIPQLKEG